MQVDEEERFLRTKDEIENKIATFTGGRAAEALVFDSITTGAANDIEQATKLARAMVTRFGMAEEFGMVALDRETDQYLGGNLMGNCSGETQAKIDNLTVAIVKAQYDKAYQLLSDNQRKLHDIAHVLYEKETITGEEFMELMSAPALISEQSQP